MKVNITELVAIILAVGALLPLLTSIVQQPRWSKRTRTVMAVVVSILAGIVTHVSTAGLALGSPSQITLVLVSITLLSAAAYRNLWKPLGVAPALEQATTFGGNTPASPDPARDIPGEVLPGQRYLDADDNGQPDTR